MTSLPQRLQAIRERLERATKGPWTGDYYGTKYDVFAPKGEDVVIVANTDCGNEIPFDDQWANMDFIAHSPQDIQFLLQAVEVMRENLESINKSLNFYANVHGLRYEIPQEIHHAIAVELPYEIDQALTTLEKLAQE